MRNIISLIFLFVCLQFQINLISAGIEHLTQNDAKCFPYDFVYNIEEKVFVRLIVIPYLTSESLRDLSRLETIPDNNPRYNSFLTCIWKDRKFQNQNGDIDFDAIERDLADAIGKEVGSTGPGMNLSKVESKRIVDECKHLGGLTQGQKVVLVRNCILTRIRNFGRI
ncbi:hypothetical protein ILUMI_18904 [Ignelater luminosus]|uniref:Uncharacterized protein n=1 Tax=Ignelater luminosus TaxID=2038154 RepID=A0A8K0CJ28_IGNLU|nr:hypothetical protein ILUMI_18904 [Ignelater luminosus]